MNPLRIALLVLVGALVGCGDPVEVAHDLAAPDLTVGDMAACRLLKPYAASEPACDACAEMHCCAEVNACYGSPSCDEDYVNCYLGCGLSANADAGGADVAACVADCGAQYPAGKQAFDAAIGCVDSRCASACK